MEDGILIHALRKGWNSGTAGLNAGIVQVVMFMWLRTVMNYQYAHGGSASQALHHLWTEGGVGRLYQGLLPALMQAPLSRFGDTAGNVATLTLLANSGLPIALQTATASLVSAGWRMLIMPIDTAEGQAAVQLLRQKVARDGGIVLWHGAWAAASATAVGHFPWFLTFNLLQSFLGPGTGPRENAFIGLAASLVSDCVSNSLRVLKTVKQTSAGSLGYREAARLVVEKEGLRGLLGRGLKTKLFVGALQGVTFTVLWRHFQGL